MTWVLVVGGAWTALALGAALLIGSSIHLADVVATEPDAPNFVVDPSVPLTEALEVAIPKPAPSPEVALSDPLAPVAPAGQDAAVPAAHLPVIGQCIPAEERAPSAQSSEIV
jgi:hypothetical protein